MVNNWIEAIADYERQGQPYVLLTLLAARGSTPRDSGTKMVVAESGSHGSIGGGHLEYQALAIAAEMLRTNPARRCQRLEQFPLGPKLGQCCGGSVAVLFESFPGTQWRINVFGAGHVGKAAIDILAKLPCQLRWIDSRAAEFPNPVPANVQCLLSDDPASEVERLAAGSCFLILTHNHQLDYAILEAVLRRGDAAYIGLIGSATKWRRFQLRLEHRGFAQEQYRDVRCPVGLSQVPGKHPVEVAVSIAGELIADRHQRDAVPDIADSLDKTALQTIAGHLLASHEEP